MHPFLPILHLRFAYVYTARYVSVQELINSRHLLGHLLRHPRFVHEDTGGLSAEDACRTDNILDGSRIFPALLLHFILLPYSLTKFPLTLYNYKCYGAHGLPPSIYTK